MYDYSLNDKQKIIAQRFVDVLQDLKDAGITVVDEKSTGVLCLINSQDVEFDKKNERKPVLGTISTQSIKTDKIRCAYNDIVTMEPGEILNVVPPRMAIITGNFDEENDEDDE